MAVAEQADIIGGFPTADPNCKGCGKPLLLENAWMTDGCPCNHALGVNSLNETRWRLLMTLQQRQQYDLERARAALTLIGGLGCGGKGESAVHVIASSALLPFEQHVPPGQYVVEDGDGERLVRKT